MGIEVAMAVTSHQRAAAVGGAFKSIVNDPAGLSRIPQVIQAKVAGRSRSVVNAAVAHIHHKT